MKQLIALCQQRRSMSNGLPIVTMRHDPRVHEVQELDAQISNFCRNHGISEAEAYRAASARCS